MKDMKLDRYFKRLLNEARTPEETRRVMEYRFVQNGGVPEDVFNTIFEMDPTKPNKKSYSTWVLSLWPNERQLILDSIENGKLRLLFHYFKTRNNEGLVLTSFSSLREAIDMLPDIDTVLEKIGNGPENNFDIVYDTPEWKIAVPHCVEASIKLGKGCRWCTAGAFGRPEHWYNTYTRDGRNGDGRGVGPLWINFDYSSRQTGIDNKDYPYTRYQFLFEWENGHGEFMDYYDNRIDPSRIASMPEAVKNFYVQQNPNYERAIMGDVVQRRIEQRRANYDQDRLNDGLTLKQFGDGVRLLLLQERNDTYTIEEAGRYYLYSSEDTNDPIGSISNVAFNKSTTCIVYDCGSYPMIVLKGRNNIKYYILKRNTGFEVVDSAIINFEDHDTYMLARKRNGKTYFAADNDSVCISVPTVLNSLGRRREVVGIIRNTGLGDNFNYLEIKLDNGFHILYRRGEGQRDYHFFIVNYPIGDKFEAHNGVINCKYGIVDLRINDNMTAYPYQVYELISDRYAIIRRAVGNVYVYTVVDSVSSENNSTANSFASCTPWFDNITNLNKNNLLLCKNITREDNGLEVIGEASYLLSLNTKKCEIINHFRPVRGAKYSGFYRGNILSDYVEDGVELQIPFSMTDIFFNDDTPEKKRALNDFVGVSESNISESFKNFYKRMLKS